VTIPIKARRTVIFFFVFFFFFIFCRCASICAAADVVDPARWWNAAGKPARPLCCMATSLVGWPTRSWRTRVRLRRFLVWTDGQAFRDHGRPDPGGWVRDGLAMVLFNGCPYVEKSRKETIYLKRANDHRPR